MPKPSVSQDKVPDDHRCDDCNKSKAGGAMFRVWSSMTKKKGLVWYTPKLCNKCHYARQVELCPIKRARRDRVMLREQNKLAIKIKIAEYFKEKDYE